MNELKYCKFCNKEKPVKDFCKSGFAIKNICKECQNKKQTQIYRNSKKVDKLQKQLTKEKDNWNKLKEYIQKDYDFFGKLIDPKYGCAMGALIRVKDKMQELEGNDSNEKI